MYKIEKGNNIFTFLKTKGILLDAACGGNHTCGKCRIKVLEGNLPLAANERGFLSEGEIKQGIRLACFHESLAHDIEIALMDELDTFAISGGDTKYSSLQEDGQAIALDIGTTTIVINLLDLSNGKLLEEIRFLNPQKIYGSDVIARIASCEKEGVEILQSLLIQTIKEKLSYWNLEKVKRMSVCGNPTMTHIFMGVDPLSIAQAPYTCAINDYKVLSSQTLLQLNEDFEVQVLPPMDAYVGADVLMGIYYLRQTQTKKTSLLIDLGTNGEMSLYHKGHLFVTSAACGPAFEGGNMQCGKGAIKGAIASVIYKEGWQYQTIQDGEVNGICGSGYLSIFKEALKQKLFEESGYLHQDIVIDKQHEIKITQKDVREFQLAKSAIASAIICLCKQAKTSFEMIDQVFIAGGFGQHIQIETLFLLGLLPKVWEDKLQIVGNTAIKGTCLYAIMQERKHLDQIVKNSESVVLANSKEFSDSFMEHMIFEAIQ